MKIKNDFITNSSSTSFILANKKPNENIGKVKLKIEIDLEDLINDYSRFLTTEEILNFYGYEPLYFDEMKKVIENGGEIIIIDVSNDSTNKIETILLEKGLENVVFSNKNIEIIDGEGGY
jgi:hypothetical protein